MAPHWHRLSLGCLLLVVLALFGCRGERVSAELLTFTELAPRSVGLGDRVEIFGRNLPVGQVDEARVFFRGSLHRAGEPARADQVIEITSARVDRDRVSFELDELTLERFTGRSTDARHTTFRGRVEVALTGASKVPVVGSIKGELFIDVVPREVPRAAREARAAEARDAVAFLGLDLVRAARGSGLVVRGVRASSPAEAAGVRSGDELVSMAGVTVLDETDLVPDGRGASVALSIVRDETRVETTIGTDGFRSDSGKELASGVVLLAGLLVLLLLFGTRLGRWMSWLTHRLDDGIARHRRPGGSLPAALLRAALHDARRGVGHNRPLSAIAPAVVFVGASATFASLPFLEMNHRAELDLGILYLLSVTALLTMGLLTGGWGSSDSAIWGRLRAVLDVFVCELPAASALTGVVLATGSLRVRDVVLAQMGARGGISELGGVPWAWNALKSPHLFLLFALFFVTALVDGSRTKTLPAADSTRVAGGLPVGSAAFFFAEWMHLFVMCALATIAFLGGYGVPGVSPADLSRSVPLEMLGCALFLLKCWLLLGLVLVARATLPRLRPRTILRLGLKVLLPACAVGLGLTVLSLQFPLVPGAERALGLLTLGTVSAAALLIIGSVVLARPTGAGARFRARVNPLL